MSDSKHTPGPWILSPRDNSIYVGEVAHGKKIADVRGWGWLGYLPQGAEIQDANARLIAAAPDMLTALEQALNALYFAQNSEAHGAMVAVEAAITRARGTP